MRYIQALTEQEQQALQTGHKEGKTYQYRNRCQAILLSSQGMPVSKLCELYGIKERTVYSWFNRYETLGIQGLTNKQGRGRKAIFSIANPVQVALVVKTAKAHRQSLKQMQAKLEKELDREFSRDTLKRFLKKRFHL